MMDSEEAVPSFAPALNDAAAFYVLFLRAVGDVSSSSPCSGVETLFLLRCSVCSQLVAFASQFACYQLRLGSNDAQLALSP